MATQAALIRERLARQQLVRPRFTSAADLVRWLGAVQAQDYLGSLWAVGQRLRDATEDFTRAERILVRALCGGRHLSRPDVYSALARGGVSPEGQRGIQILGHLAQQQVLCFGPRQGRQPTFVLLDEWVPRAKDLPRDEALATLAARYFASHGPATLQDFAWWSGLPMRDARLAMEAAAPVARRKTRAAAPRRPLAALLPPWDEYVVAYRDRAHAMGHLRAGVGSGAMAIGKALTAIDARVLGSWRRELTPSTVRVHLEYWTQVNAAERSAVARAAERYARFLGRTLR